jgi:hypothetical protein
MAGPDKTAPPDADPKAGRNAGYAENQARDKEDARQQVIPPRPSPDAPGLGHDPDAQPDPAAGT